MSWDESSSSNMEAALNGLNMNQPNQAFMKTKSTPVQPGPCAPRAVPSNGHQTHQGCAPCKVCKDVLRHAPLMHGTRP